MPQLLRCLCGLLKAATAKTKTMKKIFFLTAALLTTLTAWSQPRNLFVELGYDPAAVEAKVAEVFNDVFHGPNKVYFEVGDTMAYVSDVKNHDVRTEGMSYGMMVAVQLDKKDMFDRLWRWSRKYMQHQSGPREGYFAWSCRTDGTRNAQGAASDGELYFITALIFASNRWGNDTGIDYKAEAQRILRQVMPREYEAPARPPFGPAATVPGGSAARNEPTRKQRIYLIDPDTHLITFTPDGFGQRFTDPSYHVPAFYEVWARWADDGNADLWRDCAVKARELLHKATHPLTGLNGDMCQYDGQPMQGFGGRRNGSNNFRYDSWRVPMNIALDYTWSGADADWQRQYGERLQNFFYSQGIDTFVDQYRVDGTRPSDDEILAAGGFPKALRHSLGLVATTAAASLLCTHDKRKEFVDQLWNTKHEPLADGFFDAYYDGLLRLFAFMHLSGKYRVIEPSNAKTTAQWTVANGQWSARCGRHSVVIDADKGARILSFSLDGKEVISQTKWPESFGSTFWTSPQKEWNWPPVPEFDKQPYSVSQREGRLCMKSSVAPRLQLSVAKEFAFDEADSAFVVTYSITNCGDSPRQVAPWEITRVANDGVIFFEAPGGKTAGHTAPTAPGATPAAPTVPGGFAARSNTAITFTPAHGAQWYLADEAPTNRKVNADGKGWLAYCAKGLLLLKVFPDLDANQPAPDEAEIQVYVNQRKTHIELESQGAYTTLQPQQSLSWTVRWYLLSATAAPQPSPALLKQVRNLTGQH